MMHHKTRSASTPRPATLTIASRIPVELELSECATDGADGGAFTLSSNTVSILGTALTVIDAPLKKRVAASGVSSCDASDMTAFVASAWLPYSTSNVTATEAEVNVTFTFATSTSSNAAMASVTASTVCASISSIDCDMIRLPVTL